MCIRDRLNAGCERFGRLYLCEEKICWETGGQDLVEVKQCLLDILKAIQDARIASLKHKESLIVAGGVAIDFESETVSPSLALSPDMRHDGRLYVLKKAKSNLEARLSQLQKFMLNRSSAYLKTVFGDSDFLEPFKNDCSFQVSSEANIKLAISTISDAIKMFEDLFRK